MYKLLVHHLGPSVHSPTACVSSCMHSQPKRLYWMADAVNFGKVGKWGRSVAPLPPDGAIDLKSRVHTRFTLVANAHNVIPTSHSNCAVRVHE
jgi:hypothetical protein